MRAQSTSTGVAGAQLILWLLALCFAAVSAAYWMERLADYPVWCGVAVAASVLVSLAGPACASNIKSRGLLLVLPALVFLGADCWQNMRGVQSFDFLSNGEAIQAAQSAYDKAYDAYYAIPDPDATGAIRKLDTWETVKSNAKADLDAASTALAEAKAPKFADQHVVIAMAGLQLALCFALALLGKGRRPDPQEAVQAAPVAHKDQPRATPAYDPKVISIMDKIGQKVSA